MARVLRLFVGILCVGGLFMATAQESEPACSSLEYRQFDFWVGNWDVYDYSTGAKGDFAGTNDIKLLFNDCVLQENWVGNGGLNGSSYNIYSQLDKKWHQTWVDNRATLLVLAGEFKDGKMILEGQHPGRNPGVTVMERITWNLVDNDPNQVRQFWEFSRDGGTTWEVAFDGLYVRK
jgi:hypothetical protein